MDLEKDGFVREVSSSNPNLLVVLLGVINPHRARRSDLYVSWYLVSSKACVGV
jgi:hypothetical protein